MRADDPKDQDPKDQDPKDPVLERTATAAADATDDAAADDATIAEMLLVPPTHQVNGVDLKSLAVVASLFYTTAFLALGVGLVVVWLLASVVGVVGQFEEFMQSIGFSDFHVLGPQLIVGSLLLGASLVIFLSVMTVLAGGFYNVMASYGRGVQLRVGVAPTPTAEPAAAPRAAKPAETTDGKNGRVDGDAPTLAAPAIAAVPVDAAAAG